MTSVIPEQIQSASKPTTESILRGVLRRPAGMAALIFLVILVIVCVAAPLFAPYDPQAQDLTRMLSGPTSHNLLGTDQLGRDVLSRLIYGGRRSLLSVLEAVAVVLALGVPLGIIAGYVGGWTDSALSRIGEIVLSIPSIILILVVLAVLPQNEDAAMVAFGVLGTPTVFRVVRASTLKVREDLYIAAARVSGLSHPRIMVRHILPRIAGPIIVQASLFAAYALIFESGLAYLGLVGGITSPTWGGMVGQAATVILQDEWLLFPPGLVIALTILAFGVLGDVVRDVAVGDTAASAPRRRRPQKALTSDEIGEGSPLALLGVEQLSLVHGDRHGDVSLVDSVSFQIEPGEIVGLVGESGSGKTLTALALLRTLPPGIYPTAGRIRWKGEDIEQLSDREFDHMRGSAIAYVSQEPQSSLDPTFRIGSQLTEVIRTHEKLTRRAAKLRALELLRRVELPDAEAVARSYSHELSGGMAQRVALALALAGRPRLLIADEPTTALDVTVQAEILALLRALQQETGMAILLITHNWGVVADICDRTLVMYAGQIVERAEVQEMFDRPLHPYTLGLLESNPALAEAGAPLAAIGGRVPPPGSWPVGCRFAPRCRFAESECLLGDIALRRVGTDRDSRCVRVEDVLEEATAAW